MPTHEREQFFKEKDAANNGDYLATYPLASPDSCIARLKAEVPEAFQPWGCLSLWYHLPRTSPATSFKLLDLYEKNYQHDTVRAFAQISRAEFYVSLAKFDSAQTCLNEAQEIYARLKRPSGLGEVKLLEARSQVYQNNFAASLKSNFEYLAILDAIDTSLTQRRSILYYDIATTYERSGEPREALLWHMKHWNADHRRLERPLDNKVRLAYFIGVSYRTLNKDSSLYWTKLAVDMQQNQVKKPIPAELSMMLGRAYFAKGDCRSALPHYLYGYRNNMDKHEAFGNFKFALGLGECYHCLGKLDSARIFIQESLTSPDTAALAKSQGLLSNIFAQKGDWKSAWAAEKESRHLFQRTFTVEKAKAVAGLEAQIEAAEKSRQVAELELAQKNLLQKNLIIVLLGTIATIFFISLFFRQRTHRQLLERENKILGQEKQLAEVRERVVALELERTNSELEVSISALATTKESLDQTSKLLATKNDFINELQLRMTNPPLDGAHLGNSQLHTMKILTELDWVRFQELFEMNYPGLIGQTKSRFEGLTSAETRLFLLIKLGFDKQEIANTLGIANESVSRTRHRLGKKINLSNDMDLDIFVRQFVSNVE